VLIPCRSLCSFPLALPRILLDRHLTTTLPHNKLWHGRCECAHSCPNSPLKANRLDLMKQPIIADRVFQRLPTTTSGFGALGRRFTSLGVTRRPSEVEDLRGPLGLHILFDPLDPLVEFIFVHGLGGGSRKSWSYSDDPASFWPKEWLPQDDAFQHVRTHSFGYNADYTERRLSITNVHDFGKALLESIQNAPHLRRSANVVPSSTKGRPLLTSFRTLLFVSGIAWEDWWLRRSVNLIHES
jgi:hypothetical protein